MSNIWFISDCHFNHANIINFKDRQTDLRIRPYSSVEEHDETIVKNWNDIVKKYDTVYNLGDFAIPKRGIEFASRLNGRKILLRGNHDHYNTELYHEVFDDVRAYKVFTDRKWIASHIPIHKECIERWKLSLHGHLHSNIINDPEYLNVSCEQIQMTPISIDDVEKRVQMNIESFEQSGNVINFFHKHYQETYPNE